jgi:hypothetical protein
MRTHWRRRRSGIRSRAFHPIPDALEGRLLLSIAFYRPGSSWNTTPALSPNGNGSWTATNDPSPSWANQPGVVAVSGDFGDNGNTDIAFYRPGSSWNTIPVLFPNGDGSWTAANDPVPSWANQPGVIAIPGDFKGNGETDIAFYRPGSSWNTIPVLFPNGDGSWTATNDPVPSWANQPGVVAVPGIYKSTGTAQLTDIAFYRPGSSWNTVPILFPNGDGSWSSTNHAAPSWANQLGAKAVPGNFGGSRQGIAFYNPGSTWNTTPVLFANGDGTWSAANDPSPSWANQPGVVAVPGGFGNNGNTDIAFYRPGSTWNTTPVLFANGNGTWTSTNDPSPSWANQPGVKAVPGDFGGLEEGIAFYRPGSSWNTTPVLFANGNGSWTSTNDPSPSWANQPGVVAVPFEYVPPTQTPSLHGDIHPGVEATPVYANAYGGTSASASVGSPASGIPGVIAGAYNDVVIGEAYSGEALDAFGFSTAKGGRHRAVSRERRD